MRSASRRQLAEKYPQGTTIECVVQRVEPFGVFVRLASDTSVAGIVRKGEWDWSRGFFEITGTVSRGERFQARVIGRDGNRLVLSRRQALPNPFPDFKKKHKVGQVVFGQVTFIAEDKGVHVLLSRGVSGFIPRSEIPETFASGEGFGLLAQDWVAAEILGYAEEHVRLSIKEHLRRQDREHAISVADSRGGLRFHPSLGPQLEDLHLSLQLREYRELGIDPELRERVRRILIVEDRTDVSESLELLFDHYGFPSDKAKSVEEALEQLSQETYDLLILDINLPAASGVDLLSEIRSRNIPLYIFVLTAAAAEEWKELVAGESDLVTGFLRKPTKAADILQKLTRHIKEQGADHDHRSQIPGLSPGNLDSALPQRTSSGIATSRRERLETLLRQTAEQTHASRACVLSYRTGPRFERIVGDFPELTLELCQALDISPVGDVIKGRSPLLVSDVSKRQERFKHLLRVLPTGSFVGYPLAHSDQADYGLFLFGDRPGQLQNVAEEKLHTTALRIGQLIAEERLDTVITDNQGLLLTGFLADSLMHEIKNDLQTLDDLSDLQRDLGRKHADDLGAMTPEEMNQLRRSILGIYDITQHLKELVQLFQNLAGRPRAEVIDLNALIRKVGATLRPFAEKQRVALIVLEDEQLPEIRISPKLIEQPILNIVINGIEQTAQSGRANRWVRVATEYRPEDEYPVRVAIEDNGLGIHTVHREKIFDLFFTTKERGTGLGLYLARFLIQQTGGRLRLSRTLRFSGTEFTIDLKVTE